MLLLKKNPVIFLLLIGLALFGLSTLFQEEEKPERVDNQVSPQPKKKSSFNKKKGHSGVKKPSESPEEEVKAPQKKAAKGKKTKAEAPVAAKPAEKKTEKKKKEVVKVVV